MGRRSGPTGLPGENRGVHIASTPGKGVVCNCGGCKAGKRIQQQPKVIRCRNRRTA